MAAAYQWLKKRWGAFFAALQEAQTEDEIKRICEEEIQAWRDERPGLKSEDSFRRPLTDTCNEIKNRLSGLQRQFALQYMNFSTEKWLELNAASRARLGKRLENQKLLKEPDKIVAVATELLKSEEWSELVVGLAATTGRRLVELLQAGQFEYKTAYSVVFSGQVKRKDHEEVGPYEIPTLCASSLVLDAFNRLRLLLDTTGMDERNVSERYGPTARDAARKHFGMLIPPREGKTDIINHTFRSVYARIAVFYYCPPSIADVHYMATVHGHYKKLQESDEQRRSYESNPSYQEYKIGAPDGNVDGRQGLRLGHEGVELLEVFKPKPRKAKETMTTDTTTQEQEAKKKGKNHPVTVTSDTYDRIVGYKVRFGHRTYDETVVMFLDAYEQGQKAQPATSLTPESLAESEEEAAAILKSMKEGEDFMAYLKRLVQKELKFHEGLDKRHKKTDFTKLPTSKLVSIKDPGATSERIRRAIIAIAAYNDGDAVRAEQWFINPRVVHQVSGARYDNVNEYFKDHKEEIDALNAKYQLTQKFNSKPDAITSIEAIMKKYESDIPPIDVIQEEQEETEPSEEAQAQESETP